MSEREEPVDPAILPPFAEPGQGMTEEERQAFLTSRNNRPPDPFDRKPGHKTHPYVDSYGPEQHVLPSNDLIEHEETEDCACGPKVTFLTDGKVVTHNSLDGREKHEGPSLATIIEELEAHATYLEQQAMKWDGKREQWVYFNQFIVQ